VITVLTFSVPPAVGFDLDLTPVDSRGSMRFGLETLNRELGERVDVDAYVAEIGPPVREHLLMWIPSDRVDRAVNRFRALVVTEEAQSYNAALPGAADVLSKIADVAGRSVVISSKLPTIAYATLAGVGLRTDAIVGDVAREAKAPAMREHRIDCYVGDHPLDMMGAMAAGIPGVGVLSGNHTAAELYAAGATLVIGSLTDLLPHLVGPHR
jgi:phosphoglycolate phosphatase